MLKRTFRVLMLGTFAMQPKGTMSARAAGLASSLINRGWDVRIATVPWDNPKEAGRRYSLNNVPVINTTCISPHLAPLAVGELISVADKFGPDLIHLFKPKGFGDLAARVLRRRGVPVIVDMDDWEGDGGWNDRLPYSPIQRRIFQWQETSWPRLADGITVASRTLKQYALALDAAPRNILYLPNMLTDDRVHQLRDPSSSARERYPMLDIGSTSGRVLLYTRFVETSPEFVVAFLRKLIARLPDSTMVIAGRSADGAAEQSIRSAATSEGLADKIEWLDWIDPGDLGWIARRCNVALVPFDDSLINRAKCSVKLLELLATGIPVVASSVGENREYILRHAGGSLAQPGDVQDHVDRAVEYLGTDRVDEAKPDHHRMSWDRCLSGIEELYSSRIRSNLLIR